MRALTRGRRSGSVPLSARLRPPPPHLVGQQPELDAADPEREQDDAGGQHDPASDARDLLRAILQEVVVNPGTNEAEMTFFAIPPFGGNGDGPSGAPVANGIATNEERTRPGTCPLICIWRGYAL
jgi:hypothetical protein